MSFPARVFRVLIASPSDVTEERDIAVQTIQEWNDLNSSDRQLVLLPLRWETHSTPEYGKRPQEVINRQIVDQCDLLLAIFWTTLGSPTGRADSGTIEEIERVASKGRPVLLYFSQVKQDPHKLDLAQLAKLIDFKKKTIPNALVETYSTHIEFKDKLERQLEMQLRSLVAAESEGDIRESSTLPVTDIVLHFANADDGSDIGDDVTIDTRLVGVTDFDKIPDYSSQKLKGEGWLRTSSGWGSTFPNVSLVGTSNKDYIRQHVTYQILQGFFRPLRFWLKNKGGVGARDVHIDISIQSRLGDLVVLPTDNLPAYPPSTFEASYGLRSAYYASRPEEVFALAGKSWSSSLEISALQPQRQVSPAPSLLIGAMSTCDVAIHARIYADTLAEPLDQVLQLNLNVSQSSVTADQAMGSIIESSAPE